MTAARSILLSWRRLGLALVVLASACIEVEVDAPTPTVAPPPVPTSHAPAPRPAAPARAQPAVPAAPAAEHGDFVVREPVEAVAASLELLEAGAEPRTPIAVAAKPGERTVLRIGLAMEVAMKIGTSDVPKTTLPPLEVDVAVEVAKTTAERIDFDLRVVDVRMDEAAAASERVRAAVQRTVEGLRTSTGTLVLAADGRVQSIVMSAGGDAIENRAAGLDHALVELLPAWPRVPVGVGARWRLVQPVVRGGVTLQRTTEYRLVARSDAAIELEVESTHVAQRGGDAAQGTTRIEAQSGDGRGRIVLAPGEVLPKRGEITTHTTTRAAFGGAPEGVFVEIGLVSSVTRTDVRP